MDKRYLKQLLLLLELTNLLLPCRLNNVKSVVRYSDGSVNVWIDYNNQEHWLVDKALQNLADQINNLYLSIIGRPAEKDGMMYYYRIYEYIL